MKTLNYTSNEISLVYEITDFASTPHIVANLGTKQETVDKLTSAFVTIKNNGAINKF